MGNSYCCQEYYLSLPCAPSSKRMNFIAKLGKSLSDSEFRDISLRTIERYYDDALELEKQEVLRHSIASFNHYESNNLNYTINEDPDLQESSCQLPTPILAIAPENRQRYLLKLIRESYLFLDFSDCLDNRNSYDIFMRHELMRGDTSFESSFAIENSSVIAHLQAELRNFNEELVCKLQNYVRFCRKVKHDFLPDRQRFLSKLNLNLQSQIIQKYLNREFRKNTATFEEMIQDIEEILRILIITVEMMYDFHLTGENLSREDQLFNSLNIYTMITSILFESEDFASFIINKIKECFRNRFNIYRNEATYTTSEFINDFIALNSRDSRRESRNSNNLSHLLSYSNYSSITIFPRSLKILQKLFGKSVPLFKLKIIYQLNQQLSKQLEELKRVLSENYSIEVSSVFTRETELLVIKWLLKANPHKIDDISAHLLYTYHFVHPMHLMDKKGSCLVTFMQQIERILQWTRPS